MDDTFVEKRMFWGQCYGLLDRKRMAAVIIRRRMIPGENRVDAKRILSTVEDGKLFMDDYTKSMKAQMREWEIPG